MRVEFDLVNEVRFVCEDQVKYRRVSSHSKSSTLMTCWVHSGSEDKARSLLPKLWCIAVKIDQPIQGALNHL